MNDHEGEGEEHPEREYEHGSRQVDDVVTEGRFPAVVFPLYKRIVDTHPTAKTRNV